MYCGQTQAMRIIYSKTFMLDWFKSFVWHELKIKPNISPIEIFRTFSSHPLDVKFLVCVPMPHNMWNEIEVKSGIKMTIDFASSHKLTVGGAIYTRPINSTLGHIELGFWLHKCPVLVLETINNLFLITHKAFSLRSLNQHFNMNRQTESSIVRFCAMLRVCAWTCRIFSPSLQCWKLI